jgi:predicted DNA-binding transcriptional regulator YafY
MGNLYERIKQTIQKFKPALKPIEEPTVTEEAKEEVPQPVRRAEYLSDANMVYIIRQASAKRHLVYLLYNNMWRYVEPYSFRQGEFGTLFYGHDLLRNGTRSYYINRIQELQSTIIPYAPRWFVEIG